MIFARHGRERAADHGCKIRPRVSSNAAAGRIGRPQRSDTEAEASTPPTQGRRPCTHGGQRSRSPNRHPVRPTEVQGQRPCGDEVLRIAQASERRGLPTGTVIQGRRSRDTRSSPSSRWLLAAMLSNFACPRDAVSRVGGMRTAVRRVRTFVKDVEVREHIV